LVITKPFAFGFEAEFGVVDNFSEFVDVDVGTCDCDGFLVVTLGNFEGLIVDNVGEFFDVDFGTSVWIEFLVLFINF